jgi:hypothetical protein
VESCPDQWDYPYPLGAFRWNPGEYLPTCSEVDPEVANEGPALLRAKEAESLIEIDGAVEILVEEVAKCKENIVKEPRQPRSGKAVEGFVHH